jgi:AmmeMemoRadiSam system protein B
MDVTRPQIRPVEAFPVEVDGRQLICLRDPLYYATESLLVPPPAFFLLTLLDGAHSLVDVQAEWAGRFGTVLDAAELREFLDVLDRHHYLRSDGFDAHERAIVGAFHETPLRQPMHAGSSYPAEPEPLRRHLDGFFDGVAARRLPGVLRGLVAPHIDLRVGGTAYGHAYAALAAAPDAERFVILGTAHQGGRTRVAATRKDFATPLGTVPTDRAFLDRVARRMPEDLYADELLHRVEHAVEFQVVLLQHLLGARRSFSIVPLLVESLHDLVLARRSPRSDPRMAAAVDALRSALAEDPRPTVLIAAVDFAHVGAKFGDEAGLTSELLARTEAKDRRLIAAIERADPEGFFDEVAADGDGTRICGLAPLYTFLTLMDGARGELLHYDRSRDDATASTVSYASLALTGAA